MVQYHSAPLRVHQPKERLATMRKRKTGNPLRDLVNIYPISKNRAFEIARVHRTTFERWWNGISRIPPATLELIRLVALAELPDTGKFQGWRIQGDYLVDSNGVEYHHDDIKRIWFYKQMWSNYRDLRQQVDNARKSSIPKIPQSA
jgi:hypothetical protein